MTYPMESVLDTVAEFIQVNAAPAINALLTGGNTLTVVLGDPGMGIPSSLPTLWIVPLYDSVKPYTAGVHGVDFETFAIPLVIVEDLPTYGPAVANSNAAGTFEFPGYRRLLQYGQIVRQAFRGSAGKGITLGGQVATSFVPAISTVWVTIDSKPYRGLRIALQIQTRVQRV